MEAKVLSILEHYDLIISQVRKGRGGFIIETQKGNYFFREYNGNTQKLSLIYEIQELLKPEIPTDTLVKTKENTLFVKDNDENTYLLKELINGRECNYKNEEEVLYSFSYMAKLHLALKHAYESYLHTNGENCYQLTYHSSFEELQKHTKECRHIRKYLVQQKNKTEFERILLQYYDVFLEKAEIVSQKIEERKEDTLIENTKTWLYHGDFQYHNLIFCKNNIVSINYEHLGLGSGTRDFCYLFRKINEKNNWDISFAKRMLTSYLSIYHPTEEEWNSLCLSLSYPIKFWKIVNFYYNNRKSWISGRNLEKLNLLLSQELQKEKLLAELFPCTF